MAEPAAELPEEQRTDDGAAPQAASSSGGPEAAELDTQGILDILGKRTDKLQDSIQALRGQRDDLSLKRKEINKELKNSKRRKQRLASKAKEMTNEDLLDVINMRLQKEKAK